MKNRASVLLVDDDAPFRTVLAGELERLGFGVATAASGGEALETIGRAEPQVVLLDLRLPDSDGLEILHAIRDRSPATDIIMLTGHGSLDIAVASIRAGAFDYVAKPCPLDELEIRIDRALERQALRSRTSLLERALTPPDVRTSLVGGSPAFVNLIQLAERVAPTDSTVLVTGETGCGKEVIAKLLHARSARADRPFVIVECAALQESLLQSELFGHERGAFTGADRAKPGLFEVAHGGTIFLDEIGEISQTTQVKLLRVLDTGLFRHVGGTAEIRVNARIIAATNRDLAAMVPQGLFREDLFYRLSTITLRVPSLRERRDDIGRLADYFVGMLNDRFGCHRHLGESAREVLEQHDWPGNVRELLHAIEAAMIVSDHPEIRREHLPSSVRPGGARTPAAAGGNGRPLRLDELERAHIEAVLRETNGHRASAARALGISERNLYRKLREYHLL
jgi:DNA-binding NtrC family response regulator